MGNEHSPGEGGRTEDGAGGSLLDRAWFRWVLAVVVVGGVVGAVLYFSGERAPGSDFLYDDM